MAQQVALGSATGLSSNSFLPFASLTERSERDLAAAIVAVARLRFTPPERTAPERSKSITQARSVGSIAHPAVSAPTQRACREAKRLHSQDSGCTGNIWLCIESLRKQTRTPPEQVQHTSGTHSETNSHTSQNNKQQSQHIIKLANMFWIRLSSDTCSRTCSTRL